MYTIRGGKSEPSRRIWRRGWREYDGDWDRDGHVDKCRLTGTIEYRTCQNRASAVSLRALTDRKPKLDEREANVSDEQPHWSAITMAVTIARAPVGAHARHTGTQACWCPRGCHVRQYLGVLYNIVNMLIRNYFHKWNNNEIELNTNSFFMPKVVKIKIT